MRRHSFAYPLALTLALGSVLSVMVYAKPAAVRYTGDGNVSIPDYTKWVFIGAGAFETPQTAPAPRFSHVFVDPSIYDEFVRSGRWPDGTILLGEKRAGITTMPITSNPGWGETGDPLGWELEVKDASRGGWRFYTAGPGERAGKPVANQADCTTCHTQHGAVDGTFVQFYPTLAAAARHHGTYQASTK